MIFLRRRCPTTNVGVHFEGGFFTSFVCCTTAFFLVMVLQHLSQMEPAAGATQTFNSSSFNVSEAVPVFTQGEGGYFCIKIPDLLVTGNGTLLAFGEARRVSCADHTWVDLVVKRSFDGGATWSPMQIVYSNSTPEHYVTIGNAAPVLIAATGRVLVPFCRNNAEVLQTYSDDNGATWAPPVNLTGVVKPDWKWVATGPPAGLQLASGRLLIPSYHTPFADDDGEDSHSYVMLSDDMGENWRLGGELTGPHLSNECQAVELAPDIILLNTRGLELRRLQALSMDGGETFGPTQVVESLPQPLEGVEGSIIMHPSGLLLLSNPNEDNIVGLRYNMSIHISSDNGTTWKAVLQLDKDASAYSALRVMPDGSRVGILYEISNQTEIVFIPQKIVFRTFSLPFSSYEDLPL